MINVDAIADYPFVQTTIRAGSFFGGTPETQFFELVMRVRALTLTCSDNLFWDTGTGLAPTVMLNAGGFLITSGETTVSGVTSTQAFTDIDDIYGNWRQTRKYQQVSADVASQYADIQWGDTADFTPDGQIDGVDFEGSGLLDSALLFTANSGDVFGYLGTEQGASVGGSYFLSEPTGLFLKIIVRGVEIRAQPLFMDNDTTLPLRSWNCGAGDVQLIATEWWPYEIAENPTWDIYTGTKLRNHLRLDTNGYPLAYLGVVP